MSKIKLKYADPVANEFKWFAWYPVKTLDRGWRWMRFVYKRKYALHTYLYGPTGEYFVHSVEKGVLV
jgi:hypothetical protein